jgi:thiol-disulfide isomerase/thioredoxin
MHLKTTTPVASRRQWLAALASAALAWPALATEALRQPWPRQRRSPVVRLPTLDGGEWTLESVRGKPVLLNFWASWCEPCRTEMPSLQQLAARHQAQGLQLMAVNFKEGERAIRRFMAATDLDLPVLSDRDGALAKAFGVRAFPSTVAIDRQGKVRFIVVGECDWSSPVAQGWAESLL